MSDLNRTFSMLRINDDEEELYDMHPGKLGYTGLCVVFNIVTFQVLRLHTRKGSDVDVAKIKETFTAFGFKVDEQRDKKKDEIFSYLEATAKDMDASYNCFICFFLSHGGLDEYMCDVTGAGVSIKDLAELFDGDNCKALVGKPKLFFAQMCRGVDLEEYLKNKHLYDTCANTESNVVENIPKQEDKLIAYATSPGQMARLHPINGSEYIHALTEVLKVRGTKDDICAILRRVRKAIKELNPNTGYFVCPQEDSTLSRKLIFQLAANAQVSTK